MDLFDIVILGFDRSRPDSPAAGLQRVFPIDQGTAVRLINALPATVKRSVPRTAAEQYQAALTAIGARVELRKAEPKPEPKQAPKFEPSASNALPAAAALAPSRFTGAATLKQGSPIDSVAPPSPPLVHNAPDLAVAHLATERPPADVPPAPRPGLEGPALLSTVVPDPTPASAPAPTPSAPASAGEQWGGLVAPPKPKDAPSPAAAASSPPLDEREANRQELFRRLMDPRQTGPAELSPAEAAGGISVLELDLPPPRAGWASANQETMGADEVAAPVVAQAAAGLEAAAGTSGRPAVKAPSTPPPRPVQVFEPPPDVRSFHEALPDAIALSLREGGAQWVLLSGGIGLVTAVLLIVLRSVSVLSTLVASVAALGLCAMASEQAIWTLRAVVDDLDSPDGPDLRASDLGRYFSAGFNLLGFAVVTQLPFLAWLVRHRDALPGALSSEPVGLLLLAVSAFLWPMAVGLQAIGENPLAVWSVPRAIRVIGAAFVEYATLFLAASIMGLLPLGVVLLMTRMGLPMELSWLGIALGFSLSQGTIAALIGHIARLHPRAFEDES